MGSVVGLSLTLVGCALTSSGPTPSNKLPTPIEPARSELRLVASAPHAATYDLRTPATLDATQKALYKGLQRAAEVAGTAAPATDQEVLRAAYEICRGLPVQGPPPAALVDFGMRVHGLIDPPPHLVVADVPEGGTVAFSDQLRGRLAGVLERRRYRRAGFALCKPLLTPQRTRAVVALFEGRARLAGAPRRLALGTRRRLRLQVLSSHRDPQLVIADPRGQVSSRRMRLQGEARWGDLRCARAGLYRVEVTANGRHGTEVLANFPVYCKVAPPKALKVRAARPALGSRQTLERRLLELTNALRRKRGLKALTPHRGLAKIARAHCQDMRANDFVGHVSPRTGGPAERLRRAKLPFLVVRENVARAYSVAEALEQLAQSPAHLSNLLNRDTSHLGVGIEIDRSQSIPVLLVTQNFIAPAAPFNIATAPKDALALVNKLRLRHGLPAVPEDGALSALARRYLADYRRGGAKAADGRLSAALPAVARRYSKVGGLLLQVSALEAIARAAELKAKGIASLGVAVHRRAEGRLAVFVLIATAR